MENVKELFWCDARDEQGHLQHASDCEQGDCFVVQGKQQEKNTGAKAKLPDHYRCTITCAFCGKRKHCNRCIVVDLSCDCEACSLDAPGVVTPDTAPDISEPN